MDNTVGEHWKNMELSLVAGAPQSFVQELSQPYYARRQMVALPENAMVTPQTHEATIEENEAVQVEAGAPPAVVNNGQPQGVAGGVIGALNSTSVAGTGGGASRAGGDVANGVVMAQESAAPAARAQEIGDLFEYRLHDRVTIRKNQSALVPILQARVDAEKNLKISVWNPAENRALRALWVQNTRGLTLDGGSFNVLEGDAFAGEGLMDPIKPGEKRILSYAADLGLLVDAKQLEAPQHVMRVAIMRRACSKPSKSGSKGNTQSAIAMPPHAPS